MKRTRSLEGDDDYRGVVAVLNNRWRVIDTLDEPRHWVLQQRGTAKKHAWRGIAHTPNRTTLMRCIRERVLGEISPTALGIIERLPREIEQ